jgi:hypothetical protein
MRQLSIGVLALALCAVSFAEEISYGITIRQWSNTYTAVDPGVTTQAANSPIVGFTIKKDKFFASASFMAESSYRVSTVWIARQDNDLAVGYRLNDNISILGGYRVMTLRDGSNPNGNRNYVDVSSGYYVGVSGFNLIAEKTFVYGNVAYSPISIKNDVVKYRDESLTTYELGLGYALTSSTQLVAGYRSQLFKNFNVTDNKNESGSIGGPIIGLNVNF